MRDYIGSADAAAMVGLSPWKTPLTLYLELRGELPDDEKKSDQIDFGIRFEDAVIDEFLRRKGFQHDLLDRQVHLRDPHLDYIGATLDARSGMKYLVEAKTASVYSASRWEEEGPPVHYQIQAQWQMMVSRIETCFMPVYFDSRRFEIYEIKRDALACEALYNSAIDFWGAVVDGVPPSVSAEDAKTLARLFPTVEVERVDLSGAAPAYLDRIKEINFMIKSYEAEKDLLINSLKQEMGSAAMGVLDGKPAITWAQQKRSGIDSKRLREELPEVYEQFKTQTSYRVFRMVGEL